MLKQIVTDAEVSEFFLKTANSKISRFITELQRALTRYSENPSIIPPRIVNTIPSGEAVHLYMPVIDDVYAGVKTLGSNPKAKLGFVGSVNILESQTGLLEGVFEAKQLTAIRTALASCIGLQTQLKKFQNEKVINCTVFGTGLQAFWHIFCCIKVFQEVNDCSNFNIAILYRSSKMELTKLNDILNTNELNITFEQNPLNNKPRLKDIVAKSHVIFGCIPSTDPNLTYDCLTSSDNASSHTYISLIGAYKPSMHECDTRLIDEFKKQNVPILVDSKEHTLLESGELIDAEVKASELLEIGELGENTIANITLRENGRTISLCKIVGLAIMDVCVAKKFLENM